MNNNYNNRNSYNRSNNYNRHNNYNSRNSRNNYNNHNNYNNYNNYNNNEKHPEHPVRDVFYSVCCVFFSLAFNYLWVCQLIDFDYTEQAIVISAVISGCAFLCGIVSFVKSHKRCFEQRKRAKLVRNQHKAYKKRIKNRYFR